MRQGWIALALLIACGDDGASTGSSDAGVDAAMPLATCAPMPPVDTQSPEALVGDGSPGSCTEAALKTAVAGGGTVVFNCGAAPVTITVTSQVMISKETILDGHGLVTLSGGGTSRMLYLDSDYNTPTPRLT